MLFFYWYCLQYLKETNAFLEAERSVYMESLRDLQEKLKVAFQENTQNQELAKESKKIALQFKEEKENLMWANVTIISFFIFITSPYLS